MKARGFIKSVVSASLFHRNSMKRTSRNETPTFQTVNHAGEKPRG